MPCRNWAESTASNCQALRPLGPAAPATWKLNGSEEMSMRVKTTVLAAAIIIGAAVSAIAQTCPGSPGCLDGTFGTGGKSLIPGNSNNTIYHLLTQSDGKIVAMNNGNGVNGHRVFRLNPDGSLDTAFGNSGVASFNWSIVYKNATYYGNSNDVALQEVSGTQRILVVGQTPIVSGNKVLTSRLRIDRLMPDGSLDPSWGTGGILKMNTNSAISVAVQSDQKIVLVSATYGTVLRLNANGTVDTTFGLGGTVTGAGDCRNVAIDTLGRIVIANLHVTGNGNNKKTYFAARRYSASGVREMSFGGTGQTVAFQTQWIIGGLAIDPFGNILISSGFNGDFFVARLDPGGFLDSSFSDDGVAALDFAGFPEGPAFVAAQSDGKVVIAGEADFAVGGNSDYGVVRFNFDGSLDNTFGNGGKVSFGMNGEDYLRSIAIYNDAGCACEKILVAGGGPGYQTFARLITN